MNKSKFFFTIILVSIVLMMIPVTAAIQNFSSPGIANASSDPQYFITIDPIGDHTVGDVFIINGTTNLPATETLEGQIQSMMFTPGGGIDRPYARLHNIPITSMSSGTNRWSVNVTEIAIEDIRAEYHVWIQYSISDLRCDPMNYEWWFNAWNERYNVNSREEEFLLLPTTTISFSSVQTTAPQTARSPPFQSVVAVLAAPLPTPSASHPPLEMPLPSIAGISELFTRIFSSRA